MPTGAELFIDTIQKLGIEKIFTLVGDHLNPVLAAASRTSLDIIHMRHEAAVIHAADITRRVTRRPALSLVTGGPGHTNSLTGTRDCLSRREPGHCRERKPPQFQAPSVKPFKTSIRSAWQGQSQNGPLSPIRPRRFPSFFLAPMLRP
jgi:glyoxylate carboligase